MSTLGNNVGFGKFFKLDNISGTGDSSYTLLKDGQNQTNLIAEQLIVSVNGTIPVSYTHLTLPTSSWV